jgi:hypothetical protein
LPRQEARRPDVAARDRMPRLLHERIAAVIERDGMHDARLLRLVDQLLGFRGGHRQRLVGNHVLFLRDRGGIHGVVQVVRRRVVHDLNGRIVEQRLVAPVGLGNAKRVRLLLRRLLAAAGNRQDVHEPETPHGVHMMRADEAGADDAHPDTFHAVLQSAAIIR